MGIASEDTEMIKHKEFIYLSDSLDVLKSEIKELNKEMEEKYLELEKK